MQASTQRLVCTVAIAGACAATFHIYSLTCLTCLTCLTGQVNDVAVRNAMTAVSAVDKCASLLGVT